jgi:hypothetical protein
MPEQKPRSLPVLIGDAKERQHNIGSKLCSFPLRVVCGCFGRRCDFFLGLVALQWLRGLGKLEKFEAEVILGFRTCSSR